MLAEWINTLWMRSKALFRRRQLDRDLNDELQFHIAMREQKLQEHGMSPEEAHYSARRQFGNATEVKEANRELWAFAFLETVWQDLCYGLRQLRRSPGFTAAAVITLALGIGATTGIFSVFNAVLLQPLPYPDSSRIVQISRRTCDGCFASASVPMFVYWQENNPGFEDLTAYQIGASVNLSGGDKPELVDAIEASKNYFRLFGANPILGRTFTAAEDRPCGPRVLIMSYGLWQRRFGGDPSILGRTITLESVPYSVIGVLSPAFQSYPRADVWVPLQADPNSTNQAHNLAVDGRLPPGATLAQANSWMAVIGKRYAQTHLQQLGGDDKLQVTPLQQQITGNVRPALLILMGAVWLVLLIACANVANLLLGRAAKRKREIAVRTAVGAGRIRIILQLLTENLLLALGGGALGLALGLWGVRALLAFAPVYLPRAQQVKGVSVLDPWIAGFTAFLVIISLVLFGLFPALQLSRTDLVSSLKDSGGRAGNGPKHRRARGVLTASEMAMAVILLCGAALLIRSFVALHNQSLGFDPHNLLAMEISLAGPGHSESKEVARIARQIAEHVDAIPGVESAAVASDMPLTGGGLDMIFNIPGHQPAKGHKFTGDVQWRFVSPQYFTAMRIPLLSGRFLGESEPRHTVVINQAMAHKFWPSENPVGRTILVGAGLGPIFEEGSTQIVGVIGDIRQELDGNPAPMMYQAFSQIPNGAMAWVNGIKHDDVIVRMKPGVAPMSMSHAVQQVLMTRYGLAAAKVRTMKQVGLDSTARRNFSLFLLGLFAAIALLLAAVGLYAVIAYTVSQRTHEIGIRMALGAQKADVVRLVVGQGMAPALLGLGGGIIGALGLTRFLSGLLYGVKPADPLTFCAVSLMLVGVASLACYVPARRAAKVDPMIALRQE